MTADNNMLHCKRRLLYFLVRNADNAERFGRVGAVLTMFLGALRAVYSACDERGCGAGPAGDEDSDGGAGRSDAGDGRAAGR